MTQKQLEVSDDDVSDKLKAFHFLARVFEHIRLGRYPGREIIYPIWPGDVSRCCRRSWKELLQRWMPEDAYIACCHSDLILDKQNIMDGWMDK